MNTKTLSKEEVIDEIDNYISEQLEHFDMDDIPEIHNGMIIAFENIQAFIQTLKQK